MIFTDDIENKISYPDVISKIESGKEFENPLGPRTHNRITTRASRDQVPIFVGRRHHNAFQAQKKNKHRFCI